MQAIDFQTQPSYEIVEQSAKQALIELNATVQNNLIKSDKIYEKACELYPVLQTVVNLDVFRTYLSTVSRKTGSSIVRPTGKHGYYLMYNIEQSVNEEEVKAEQVIEKAESERKEREKKLYPLLKLWMIEQGYRTKDTSSIRVMGKWGNPDITGIKVEDNFVSTEIEIATIEAKFSYDNWEYNIFEAISHRRFSNRAYFAFPRPFDLIKKTDDKLRYYSELYNVGVLAIGMSTEDYSNFKDEKLAVIDPEQAEIYELYSARFVALPLRYQRDFLNALGISKNKELYSWGDII